MTATNFRHSRGSGVMSSLKANGALGFGGLSKSLDPTSRCEFLEHQNLELRNKVDRLEHENQALKRSVYDLSTKLNKLIFQASQGSSEVNVEPFDITSIYPRELREPISESKSEHESPASEDTQRRRTSRKKHRSRGHDRTKKRVLHWKYDLEGHTAAVYTVHFSSSGHLLASGSFDSTVRIWNLEKTDSHEVHCLEGHELCVVDASWSSDSNFLVSGSYDRSARLWDISNGSLANTYSVDGFVLTVSFDPVSNDVFYLGTTSNKIYAFDRRQSPEKPCKVFENDSFVNSLFLYRNGSAIISGDKNGYIKAWSTSTCQSMWSIPNIASLSLSESVTTETPKSGETPKPNSISYLSSCPPRESENQSRMVAVNSYDDVLRIYDRSKFVTQRQESEETTPNMHLFHELSGHKNKSWPIKNSFFMGRDYKGKTAWAKARKNESDSSDLNAERKMDRSQSAPHLNLMEHGDTSATRNSSTQNASKFPVDADTTVLLATGSADGYCYLYDVGGPKNTGFFAERLEGHKERVYGVNFHPTEPVLATCSADQLVKIWAPQSFLSTD